MFYVYVPTLKMEHSGEFCGGKYIAFTETHFFRTQPSCKVIYEGWNFNSGNYLFTTDTK